MKTMRIGRDPENEIRVDNPHVSRHHADLEINQQGVCVLVDQNSTNGSFVNNQRITRQELKQGDRVVLGSDYELPWMKYLPTIPAGRRTEAIDPRKTVPFEEEIDPQPTPNPRPNPVPHDPRDIDDGGFNVREKLATAINVIAGGIVLQVLIYVIAFFAIYFNFYYPAMVFILIMMFLAGGVGSITLTQLKSDPAGAKGWVIAGLVVCALSFPTSLVFLIGNIKALRVIRVMNDPSLADQQPSYRWVWIVLGLIIVAILRVISRM